jgi:predicted nucleic acid-binding protein
LRVLVDTNVVLDVLLDREPFVEDSADILARVETGEVSGWLCATTVTTLFYLIAKAANVATARAEVQNLLSLFEIAPVNRPILDGAIALEFSDFEAAVLHEAARQVEAQAIVTRNVQDFDPSEIPVYTPEELKAILDLRPSEPEGG